MIRRIRRRIRDGDWPDRREAARQLSRTYHKRAGTKSYNEDGVDVFAADWDNLLVLDACRYDTFERALPNDLSGRLERRISRGSMTREWVRGNFTGQHLDDTVYVTANGTFARIRDEIGGRVHAEVPLWHDEYREGPGNSVAPPEVVADATMEANDEYPEKRLVAHFVQPHTPYLGPSGDRFDPRVPLSEIPRRYDVTHAQIWQAYVENLDLAMTEVERLLEALPGKTVVTADHGELLGEPLRPVPVSDYGHPDGIYVDELVTVPWFVSTDGTRKTITTDPPVVTREHDRADVESHLRDLGYTT